MAKYTETLEEWVAREAYRTENLASLDDLNNIARRTVFALSDLSLIDAEYRDYFPLQIYLRFEDDEIGFETELKFQKKMAQKILAYHDFINATFKNLKHQAYTEYIKTHKDSHGTRQVVGNESADGYNNKNGTHDINTNENDRHENVKTDINQETRSASNTKINNLVDTTHDTGSQTNNKFVNNYGNADQNVQNHVEGHGDDVSNTVSNNTGEYQNNTHYDNFKATREYEGYKESSEYNSDDKSIYNSDTTDNARLLRNDRLDHITENENLRKFTDKHSKGIEGAYTDDVKNRHDENSMAFAFDTPQGSLEGLREPDGQPGGSTGDQAKSRGIGFVGDNNRKYNYFSEARESDATGWDSNKASRSYGKDINGNDAKYKETTEDVYNIDGEDSYDRNIQRIQSGPDDHQITFRDVTDGEIKTINFQGDAQLNLNSDVSAKRGDDTREHRGHDDKLISGKYHDTKSGEEIFDNTHSDKTMMDSSGNYHNASDGSSNKQDHFNNYSNGQDNLVRDLQSRTVSEGTVKDDNNSRLTSQNIVNDVSQIKRGIGTEDKYLEIDQTHRDTDKNINDTHDNDDDIETFKLDLTKWFLQPNMMDRIFDLFRDLFMIVL